MASAFLESVINPAGQREDDGDDDGIYGRPMVTIAGVQSGSGRRDGVTRQLRSFVRKTKRGSIVKIVREHYLRRDIATGFSLVENGIGGQQSHCVLPDTNVALHFLDFLEAEPIKNVIVCTTVLEEIRHRNIAAYGRMRALLTNNPSVTIQEGTHRTENEAGMKTSTHNVAGKNFFFFSNEHHAETFVSHREDESINDRNDRAIRRVATFYNKNSKRIFSDQRSFRDSDKSLKTILLTEDRESLKAAQEMGLPSMTVMDYIKKEQSENPVLLDLVARVDAANDNDAADEEAGDGKERDRKKHKSDNGNRGTGRIAFPEHLPMSAIRNGLGNGNLHQGTMKTSRFNPFTGHVNVRSLRGDDRNESVKVVGKLNMNRAFDGDIVIVEIIEGQNNDNFVDDQEHEEMREGEDAAGIVADVNDNDHEYMNIPSPPDLQSNTDTQKQQDSTSMESKTFGRVVGIIKRNWRSRGYAGSLRKTSVLRGGGNRQDRIFFIPLDNKIPMIMIMTRQFLTLKDKRIIVKIDGWDRSNGFPHGHYVKTIGVSGDKLTESNVVLFEYDIDDNPFSSAVYNCVPKLPWKVDDDVDAMNDPNRQDLRHLNVCSVDPPGCKDIDDALHCIKVTGKIGNESNARHTFEIGVHIADVTHFMRPHTALDIEASKRCTSTYLVDRRIDMLPKALTEDICSLRAHVDRFAFSVIWIVDYDTADILDTRFTRSIIRSRAALSYIEAQTRMDDDRMQDDITLDLRNLNHIAKRLRQKRMQAGALQLASPEVKFQLDTETHDPTDVGMYEIRDANQMIEEFMLLANNSVAQKILTSFPSQSLLRRHPAPTPQMLLPLLSSLKTIGIVGIDTSSSKGLNAGLDKCVRQDDDYFNKLVRIIATRCMTQALYFSSGDVSRMEFKHYGLAMPLYTHFTSPIRRYADDIVHRLLAAAIGIDATPDIVTDKQQLRDQVENLNYRHRNAQMAGRGSAELHTVLFFRDKPTVATARVIRVTKNGLVVFIPQYGIEGPVAMPTATKASNTSQATNGTGKAIIISFQADEAKQRLSVTSRGYNTEGVVTESTFTLFDKCNVQIAVEEGQVCRRLVLSLVL